MKMHVWFIDQEHIYLVTLRISSEGQELNCK